MPGPTRHAATPRRLLAGVLLAATLAACGSSTPSAAPTAGASSAPTAVSSASGSLPPSTAPSPSPTAIPTPRPTPRPSAPTVASFWAAVARGLSGSKHLTVTVSGSNPTVIRFQPDASASVVGGRAVSVCVGSAAYDGQSGTFTKVPGSWACGAGALVGGFRHTGQAVDAWASQAGISDASIVEKTALEADGRWRWDYSAQSVVFGGRVQTSVWLDPRTGRLLEARRTDPTGQARDAFDYARAFPAIVTP